MASATPSLNQYCTIEGVHPGQTPAHSIHCFSTFAASIAYASGGRIQLKNAAHARPLTAAELAEQVLPNDAGTGSYIYGVDYTKTFGGGQSLTFHGPGPCSSGPWLFPDFQSPWNNNIASLYSHNSGCYTDLYDGPHFGGTICPFTAGAHDTLGSCNNIASSQKWCGNYAC
ncbi:MAG TPA: hypothetical protein VJ851_13310 [Jatrophihabitans sp.]|nr:hypothetical protein [Jatrophihabitans sp.]